MNTGQHLVNRRVAFRLKDSDQASTFNFARHQEICSGPVLVAYDAMVVVRVPGWRWAHIVPADKVTADEAGGAS